MVQLRKALPGAATVGLVLASACGDDIAFKDRAPFNAPADAVAGFLGYFSVADKQTTCGNCHADEQATWSQTHHADAWSTLQASGAAQDFCEPCHTVSQNGNAVTAVAGYPAVRDDAALAAVYHDVQCESCHGPGVDHVSNPQAVKPLASILAASAATNGCGECHSGAHHPFVEQWELSKHGSGTSFSRGSIPSCSECHSAQGALVEQFGVNAKYVEKGDAPLPIVCVVCHDPHDATNPAQLRAPVGEPTTRNLCIKCHNRRTVPGEGFRGPHAAQGPLVLGQQVGWWPPGFEWLDGLTGTHGNPTANPRLCATCHVEMFEVTDAQGGFVFQSVGHLFEAIPCLDAQGIPTTASCANDERSWGACMGCHGTAANSQAFYEGFKSELNTLLDQIWVDANANTIIDPAPTDAGVLPQILQVTGDQKQIDMADTLFTAAEGILHNAQIAATHDREHFLDGNTIVGSDTVRFTGHHTSGNGVHNPPFLRNLLRASIQHAISYYGLPAPPASVDLSVPAPPN